MIKWYFGFFCPIFLIVGLFAGIGWNALQHARMIADTEAYMLLSTKELRIVADNIED